MFPRRSRLGMTMDRGRFSRARTGAAPTILSVSTPNVTTTSFTVSWTLDEVATGQVEYGTTLGLGTFTTKEASLTYSTHLQTVSGLTAGTAYFFRVLGEDADGNPYASATIAVTTSGGTAGITYDDYTLPNSWTHLGTTYQIDHTGVADSTPGVNFWIEDAVDGADATHHTRLIFPPTAVLRTNTALCVSSKVHTTLWGHAATSSAWIRGDATSYQDVGCRINPAWTAVSPHHSAFIVGARYNGFQSISFTGYPCSDVTIRGFDIRGANPSPGIYPGGGHENCNALEYSVATNTEFAYNMVRGMGGDLVRFRQGTTGHVHHNYCLNTGRMGCTAVINNKADVNIRSDHVFEYNTIDRCGYWGIDVEPEDEANTSLRRFDGLVIRNNLWGTFGSTSVGGGFAVIGGTSNPTTRHIADIEVYENVIDGTGYGSYAGNNRNLWVLVAHVTNLSAIPPGSDPRPQRVTVRDNVVTHGAAYSQSGYPSPITARYTDTLVVTDNDANLASGDWTNLTGCTNVTEGGNV